LAQKDTTISFLFLHRKGTTWTQIIRIASPIIASTTKIATLITCVVISRVNDVYVGGLKWPYFSDVGRDKRLLLVVFN
jgi:hypothetical protein